LNSLVDKLIFSKTVTYRKEINMRKIMKIVVSLLVVSTMLLTSLTSSLALQANIDEKLVHVTILETEDKIIVAEVPASLAENYKKRLTDDREFKENEIAQVYTKQNSRTLPEGEIMAQSFMYKSDVEDRVDSYSGGGTFSSLVTGPITSAIIGKIIKKMGFGNIFSASAALLSWAASDLYNRQKEWWTESYIMILEGDIDAIRLTHIRNTVSTYPAAYLILDRV
jgi:hypothetical protein